MSNFKYKISIKSRLRNSFQRVCLQIPYNSGKQDYWKRTRSPFVCLHNFNSILLLAIINYARNKEKQTSILF